MKIFPAIDIKNKKCVRLIKGDFDNITEYETSPIDQASKYKDHGFKNLHIVDLDGALTGETVNLDLIEEIVSKFENVLVYARDEAYMGEREVADVYINVMQKDLKKYGDENIASNVTHVVGVQPDHPDRTTSIDDLLNYAVDNKYDDLFTVDSKGTRNGAVRITKKEFVISGTMSRRVGSILDDCTNIHSEQDIIDASVNIKNMNESSWGQ